MVQEGAHVNARGSRDRERGSEVHEFMSATLSTGRDALDLL